MLDRFRRPLLAASLVLGLTGSGAVLVDGPEQAATEVLTSGVEPFFTRPAPDDDVTRFVPGTSQPDEPSTTTSGPAATPRATAPKSRAADPAEPTEGPTSTTTSPEGPPTLSGRVTDRAGNPVADHCFFSSVPMASGFELGRTGADGRYRISPPPFGGLVRMCDPSAHTFGWGSAPIPPFPSTGHAVADLVVERLGAVRGQVLDPDGAPVPGVCVHVVNAETIQATPSSLGDPVAATGPDGRFTQPNVYPGEGSVWLTTCDEARHQLPWTATPYTVVAGQWSETTLTLKHPFGG